MTLFSIEIKNDKILIKSAINLRLRVTRISIEKDKITKIDANKSLANKILMDMRCIAPDSLISLFNVTKSRDNYFMIREINYHKYIHLIKKRGYIDRIVDISKFKIVECQKNGKFIFYLKEVMEDAN
jgi:hypothetical protein